jgi:DNA-binding response OmpR family regulator
MAGTVVLIEDEQSIGTLVLAYLERDGFQPVWVRSGEQGLAELDRHPVRLVILDVGLPGMDGFEVCRRIRARSSLPIIMLTARDEEADRVAGLEVGADDYVPKPFSPRELMARVRAVLRRAERRSAGPIPGGDRLAFGDLEVDDHSREVRKAGTPVRLTPKEFDLLYLLASNPGQVFTRLELLEELWDFAFEGDPSTVTVHVRRLREKVEDDPSTPRHLVTVWGVGYRFDP